MSFKFGKSPHVEFLRPRRAFLDGHAAHDQSREHLWRQNQAGESVPLVVMADAWAPGYIKRLPFIRRFLFNCSYRLNSIKHKCRLVLSGKQSVAEFLVSYELVRKSRIMDLAAELHLDSRAKLGKDDWANQWFTLYLEEARGRYQASASVGNVPFCRPEDGMVRSRQGQTRRSPDPRRAPG
jgi:hypothetical protein